MENLTSRCHTSSFSKSVSFHFFNCVPFCTPMEYHERERERKTWACLRKCERITSTTLEHLRSKFTFLYPEQTFKNTEMLLWRYTERDASNANMLIFPFDNVWDFYSHSYPISHLTSNVAIWTGRLIRLISNAQSHYPSSNAGFEDNVTFSVKCDMEGISEEDVHLRFAINIVKWCNKIPVDRFFSAITLILRFLLHAFKDRFFFSVFSQVDVINFIYAGTLIESKLIFSIKILTNLQFIWYVDDVNERVLISPRVDNCFRQ